MAQRWGRAPFEGRICGPFLGQRSGLASLDRSSELAVTGWECLEDAVILPAQIPD